MDLHGFAWFWLILAGSGWFWLVLAGSGCSGGLGAQWLDFHVFDMAQNSIISQNEKNTMRKIWGPNLWRTSFWLVLAGSKWFWLVLAGSGWFWLVLAGSGWFWLVLAGSGWF